MAVQLDHLLVFSKNREYAAKLLAQILGVTHGPAKIGPFTAVHVNENLTLDFDEWKEDFPRSHYCFRVTEPEFHQILGRLVALGVPYRSLPHGAVDLTVNTSLGAPIVYWSEPDGHVWELLVESYARVSGQPPGPTKGAA